MFYFNQKILHFAQIWKLYFRIVKLILKAELCLELCTQNVPADYSFNETKKLRFVRSLLPAKSSLYVEKKLPINSQMR